MFGPMSFEMGEGTFAEITKPTANGHPVDVFDVDVGRVTGDSRLRQGVD